MKGVLGPPKSRLSCGEKRGDVLFQQSRRERNLVLRECFKGGNKVGVDVKNPAVEQLDNKVDGAFVPKQCAADFERGDDYIPEGFWGCVTELSTKAPCSL